MTCSLQCTIQREILSDVPIRSVDENLSSPTLPVGYCKKLLDGFSHFTSPSSEMHLR